MKILEVKNIKSSVDLMDEFEDGDYDFLQLRDWLSIHDSVGKTYDKYDSTNRLYISLMISKQRNNDKPLLPDYEPTMTHLREIQHYSVSLNINYGENAFFGILKKAGMKWKTETFIELEKEVCLRAQTTFNRIDYGCEWLGGGDWIEKTLYGETTDFFITGIILHEPPKTWEQEAHEILESLQIKYDEGYGILQECFDEIVSYKGVVNSNAYGDGTILESGNNRIKIAFPTKTITFMFPDSFLQGFLSIQGFEQLIENIKNITKELAALKVEINDLKEALEPNNFEKLMHLIFEKYRK